MIYVTSGTLYLTENEVDYEIDEGQVFFLKADLHHVITSYSIHYTKLYESMSGW